ncbi:MAG TPA: pitrilysin family protein [Myxococcales bacterium]|nr:pitrilysin family protein [Myxococcales bacterium]
MAFAYRTESDTLGNGLRVITVELPHLHQGLLSVYVRAGSRHETPAKSGVSHFLEHLFFRGSERFPDSAAMHAAVEDAGGNLNGYTSRDHGVYFTPLYPSGLPVVCEVLGDVLAAPLLERPAEVELERQVILEEMLDEVDDRGRDIDLENLTKRTLWRGHPLALKIAGTPQTVRRLRIPDLVAHHRRWYGARNLVLCAAGPLEHGRVLELADRHFGRLHRGRRATERPPPRAPAGPVLHVFDHDESQTEFRLSFVAPPESHPDFLALVLVRRILDDGLSSRLPFEIVERRGLCYSVHCGIDGYDDVSVFEVEGAASHGKVARAIREICRILGRLAREGPTREELERAKLRHRMALEFTLDSAWDLAAWFGGTALFREPPTLEGRAEAVDAVGAAELVEVSRRILRRSNLTVTAVGSPTQRQRAAMKAAVLEADELD